MQVEEPGIIFINSLLKLRETIEPDCIVVLDDQTSALNNAEECQIIKDFYIVHSHHTPCSLIGIWQTAFHKQMREINLNSQLLVMLDFPRDKTIIFNIARQCCPSQVKFLQSAYNHAVEKDWGHIVLDFHPKHKRMAFARSSLFPTQDCLVYLHWNGFCSFAIRRTSYESYTPGKGGRVFITLGQVQ